MSLVHGPHVTLPLAGRRAVVTGGGGGLGGAIAEALGSAGLTVHVVDHRLEAAEGVRDRISSAGGSASAHAIDISDESAVTALFDEIDSTGGPADVLVNAAGTITYAPMSDLAVTDLQRMIDVNLTATFLCMREAARRMPPAGGRIINIASTASFVAPRLAATAYSMTKGGVRQLTTAAAAELAPAGILVNAVAPGTTNTAFVKGSLDTAEQQAHAASMIPLRRIGAPDDVVGAVLFFVSTFSSYVTGQTLLVDGGRTTRSA